jgi:ABC-type amino acid transport substrate-binding protein
MQQLMFRLILSLGFLATLAPPLSGAETSGPLRVGVAPVSPPMIYKDGNQIAGLEADFAHALGKELNREVAFIELPWEDLIDALNDNRIDIIMSSMSITRPRQFRVAFSDPFLRIGQIALVRTDDKFRYGLLPKSLADQTIGVRKGTTGDLLVQQEFPRAKRKYYKSDAEGAVALTKKKIDLFIDDSCMIWFQAGLYEAKGLAVMPLMFSDELLAWGVSRSNAPLLAAANAFLKKIQASGEADQLIHRWIPRMQ